MLTQLNMNLFVSTFVNKIDKKGRVSLPSIFRAALPKDHKNEIILSKSIRNNVIDGLSVTRVNEIAKRINNLDFFSEEHEDFTTSIFSEMIPTNLDKEGRFLLPEKFQYFSKTLNPREVYEIYKLGPKGGFDLGGIFDRYKMKFSFMKDNLEVTGFEL